MYCVDYVAGKYMLHNIRSSVFNDCKDKANGRLSLSIVVNLFYVSVLFALMS